MVRRHQEGCRRNERRETSTSTGRPSTEPKGRLTGKERTQTSPQASLPYPRNSISDRSGEGRRTWLPKRRHWRNSGKREGLRSFFLSSQRRGWERIAKRTRRDQLGRRVERNGEWRSRCPRYLNLVFENFLGRSNGEGRGVGREVKKTHRFPGRSESEAVIPT